MKIILRQDHDKLGKVGDVVNVADGYARNYVLPKRIGYQASEGTLRMLEEEKKQAANRVKKEETGAKKLAAELEKISVTLPMKVGEDDKLFGSVTSQMIADAIKEKGFSIDKRDILLDDTIKALGIYTVKIHLHTGVEGSVKVWVVRE
ncbi:MAG TPA: 50S ribosomal protein L9 [Bacteroidota bacterium]|nr:50S ribosomal protein L9 [Bacteroidota bacterium]